MGYLKTTLALCGLAVLTACAGPTVRYDYDAKGNFAQYHTFDWYVVPQAAKTGVVDPLMATRIRRVVASELTAKGFSQQEAAKDPDFLVIAYPSYQFERGSGGHVGIGMGIGLGRFMGVGVGVPLGGRHPVLVGSIVLEVKDFKSNQLVWRAVAAEALDDQASPEEAEEDVSKAVKKMLTKFPPVPGAH